MRLRQRLAFPTALFPEKWGDGTTASLEGRGRKRKTNTSIDPNIVIQIKKNRFQSARNLAKKVENEHGIKITPQTIRNRIKEAGFQGRHVRKKPYLTKNHMKRRLDFAKKYRNMDINFWKKIL